MLGWEQPEALTRAEELACLKAKVKAIHDESKNLPLGNPRKRELGLAQQELGRQIHSLKGTAPKESRDALEHRFTNYLLTEVKRLVTSSEWDAAYKRAAQRLNDDHLQKTDPSDAQGRQ